MKRFFSVILCLMLVLPIVACGKKDDVKTLPKDATQTEERSAEDAGKAAEEKSDINSKGENADGNKDGNNVKTEVLPSENASELSSLVDEFNSTEDPARKEELRKELEKILNDAQAKSEAK